MKLTSDNIQEWKANLNALAIKNNMMVEGENYAETVMSDSDWLEQREGDDEQDVIDDDLFYGASN